MFPIYVETTRCYTYFKRPHKYKLNKVYKYKLTHSMFKLLNNSQCLFRNAFANAPL